MTKAKELLKLLNEYYIVKEKGIKHVIIVGGEGEENDEYHNIIITDKNKPMIDKIYIGDKISGSALDQLIFQ